VCIAIFGSFSIVVLVCKAIELQALPIAQKLLGMATSIASCASVSLLAPKAAAAEEVPEEEDEEKKEVVEEAIRDLEQAEIKKVDIDATQAQEVRSLPTPMH
jgi:hypothetical protein